MSETMKQFAAARRVSTPLVAIRTPDAAATVNNVVTSLTSAAAILRWDVMHGLVGLHDEGKKEAQRLVQTQEATVNLDFTLELLERVADDAIVFVFNAHRFWNNTGTMQGIWNLRDRYKSNGAMLVMLSTQGAILPKELSEDVLLLDEALPAHGQLFAIVEEAFNNAEVTKPKGILTKAADALVGLSAFTAEQTVAMSLSKNGLDINGLWERKCQAIEQVRGLSVWRGKESFEDIGGCDNVKNFNRAVISGQQAPRLILFIDEIEKAFSGTGTDLSGVKTELTGTMLSWMQDKEVDGEIFIGPPGAAKSAIAKAIGNSNKILTVAFDFAGMQSSLIGSSGENLRTALKVVDAMSQGRTLVIATCNSVASLPPELRRRFQLGTFFFDLPTKEERTVIWKIYGKQYPSSVREGYPDDHGWTGAEIKECCRKAHNLNLTLVQAAEYIVPVAKSAAEQIRALRTQASGKFISASHSGIYEYREEELGAKVARKMRA